MKINIRTYGHGRIREDDPRVTIQKLEKIFTLAGFEVKPMTTGLHLHAKGDEVTGDIEVGVDD